MRTKKIDEMTLNMGDIIATCMLLGAKFITHFHKIYSNHKNVGLIHHWAREMQLWYDEVRHIKYNKKELSLRQLADWFYSCGSFCEDYFNDDENEIDCYIKFVSMLNDSNDVWESIKKLFNI